MQASPVLDYTNSRRPIMASHYGASLRDPDRIQTCNLLIRSQMLYSVELRSLYVHPLRGVCECKGTFYFPFYQIFLSASTQATQ